MLTVSDVAGSGVRIITLIVDGVESTKAIMQLNDHDIHLNVGECRNDVEYDFLARACLHKLRDFVNFKVIVLENDYFASLGFTASGDGTMSIKTEDINDVLLCGAHYEK